MGESGSKCSITHLFCHIFIGKSVYCDCAWYEEYLGRIYQNLKKLTLFHVFAHNSKSILPQSASFGHAGTHFTPSVENIYPRTYLYSNIQYQLSCTQKIHLELSSNTPPPPKYLTPTTLPTQHLPRTYLITHVHILITYTPWRQVLSLPKFNNYSSILYCLSSKIVVKS